MSRYYTKAEVEVVHGEQYKGRTIGIEAKPDEYCISDYGPTAGTEVVARRAHLAVYLDGRTYYGWSDYNEDRPLERRVKDLVAKARKLADRIEADDAVRADVQALIGRPGHDLPMEGWTEVAATSVKEGDVAAVWGFGSWRRGRVVKVAKTNATVAYTTVSNPADVSRKADKVLLVPAR